MLHLLFKKAINLILNSIYKSVQYRKSNESKPFRADLRKLERFLNDRYQPIEDISKESKINKSTNIHSPVIKDLTKDSLAIDQNDFDDKFRDIVNNYKYIDLHPSSLQEYKNFSLSEYKINSLDKLFVSLLENIQTIQQITEEYDWIKQMPNTKAWLQNMKIILNYVALFVQALVEKNLSLQKKKEIISYITLFVCNWSQIISEILGEITWINELFIATKRALDKDEENRFVARQQDMEKVIFHLIEDEKSLILTIYDSVKECMVEPNQ
jgi:hypothetical protein